MDLINRLRYFCTTLIFILAVANSVYATIKFFEYTNVISVRNGSERVVMDCRYEIENDKDAVGLAIKWFYKDQSFPFYQWIINKMPQAIKSFEDRLNLSYRPSSNPHFEWRALDLLNPTTDLSGTYTCQVSNFDEEKIIKTILTVYVPASDFYIAVTSVDCCDDDSETIEVECFAEGLYPKPDMKILHNGPGSSSFRTEHISISMPEEVSELGTYTVILTETFKVYQNESLEIACSLSISRTNYREERKLIHVAKISSAVGNVFISSTSEKEPQRTRGENFEDEDSASVSYTNDSRLSVHLGVAIMFLLVLK